MILRMAAFSRTATEFVVVVGDFSAIIGLDRACKLPVNKKVTNMRGRELNLMVPSDVLLENRTCSFAG
jgi:hypothetical protein